MAQVPQPLQQALEGRYRIERELGRGGMATVFLAEDLKHHRRVAIKVLDPEVAGAIGPGRFLREIETVANLTHPHILPLHDSGDAGGLLFYVMPFVEGGSLRQRLAREGQLSLDEALRVTREIADALEHANRAGIVHRDIKPENVLLEAGHAVVADFGLARALGTAGAHRLTTVGVTVGTPAYMSPEQSAGASNLDGRCDQYSLACVLYELLAGQPPFTGPSAQSLIHQHLNVAPRPVTDLRPGVPAAVRDALAQALAKMPADRYPTMAEFAAALGGSVPSPLPAATPATAAESAPTTEMAATAVATPMEGAATPPTPRPPRLARLLVPAAGVVAVALLAVVAWQQWGQRPPAAPLKKDRILVAAFDGPPEDSTLAAAARELLCAALDQSRIVATVPREGIAQALAVAGKPPHTRVDVALARELAYRLAVRTVLEGQVGRIGTGYSIVVRLLDADSARTILTESGTAKNADGLIPALGELAKKLRAGLGENRRALAATRPMVLAATPSFEAYKLYLRGRQRSLAGDNVQARTLFRAAVALDPDFAMAWAALRFPYGNLGHVDSAIMACDEALRRPDRLTDAQRAQIEHSRMQNDGDWQGAIGVIDRALIENPDDEWALVSGNDLLRRLGRCEDALARVRRLVALRRPFAPADGHLMNEATSLSLLGRFEEARRVEASMTGVWKLPVATLNELRAGEYARAESLALAMRSDPRQEVENLGGPDLMLGRVRMAQGEFAAAESCYARFWEKAGRPEYPWNDQMALFRDRFVTSALVEGRTIARPEVAWPETTAGALITRGLRAARLGDVRTARRCLALASSRPRRERVPQGPLPSLLEATINGAEGRWEVVTRLLQPLAVQRHLVGDTDGDDLSWIRWVLADAYEHLGRADSAAAHLERITRQPLVTVFRAHASLRLVPLYAKLGRGADAQRHWNLAMRAFTRPDPALAARIEQARSALAKTL